LSAFFFLTTINLKISAEIFKKQTTETLSVCKITNKPDGTILVATLITTILHHYQKTKKRHRKKNMQFSKKETNMKQVQTTKTNLLGTIWYE